jgi:acetyl esterase/lipase
VDASDAERLEVARLERKRQRDWAKQAHPFDRGRAMDPAQYVYDDGRDEAPVLVAFAGAADKLGVAAVDFFDVVSDLPARRVYIRQLALAGGSRHELGSNLESVLIALDALLANHSPRVFAGTSVGAYHALLFGTLLRVDAVVAINPVTSVLPEVRAAACDTRFQEEMGNLPAQFLDQYGDIAHLWNSEPVPVVLMPYARNDEVYAFYAKRIAEQPNVRSFPHEEYSVLHKITADGSLRTLLSDALGCASERLCRGAHRPGDGT